MGFVNQPLTNEAAKRLMALDVQNKEILTYEKLDEGSVCDMWGKRQKVIGEFTCDRIYELAPLNHAPDDVEQKACLTREEIVRYLKGVGYGWHISDLKIYDTPKELSKFSRPSETCMDNVCDEFGCEFCKNGHIKRTPQSWCYVEEFR